MKIFGIDPGTATTGFAVIDGPSLKVFDFGTISTSSKDEKTKRLNLIYDELGALLTTHGPDILAVEKLFFSRNAKTAMAVGEARGVVLLLAHQHGLPVFEYTPNEVKQAVSGYGSADKAQVQEMVMRHLGLDELPKPDDAADALAIAICHAQTNQKLRP